MILGDYYQQPESKHIEFKEFYLKDTLSSNDFYISTVN